MDDDITMANTPNFGIEMAAAFAHALRSLNVTGGDNGGTKVKVADPEPFEGNRDAARRFIGTCEAYMLLQPTRYQDDRVKVLSVLSFIRGDAAPWAEVYRDKVVSAEWTGTWEVFKANFLKSFGYQNEATRAVFEINKLRQGSKTAEEYTTEFAVWEGRTKWNDEALCDAYEKGLNTGLVVAIYNCPTLPQNLQEWKDQARRLDGQWRRLTERRQVSRNDQGIANRGMISREQEGRARPDPPRFGQNRNTRPYAPGGFRPPFRPPHTPLIGHQPSAPSVIRPRDPDAMDIDLARREGRCFKCGERGHLARNCMSERRERVREVEMFEEVPRNAPSGKGLWRNETRVREAEVCKDEPQGTPGGSGSWKGKGRDKDDESELVRSLRERVRELELEAGFQGA
jgi:hypothetical protein